IFIILIKRILFQNVSHSNFSKVCYILSTYEGCSSFIINEQRKYTQKTYKKVTHCLFDLDGTVLDSEVIYHKIIKQICNKYGKKYTKELEIKMYGETDREICLTVVKQLKLPISADEFELQLHYLALKLLPGAPLQKGAERLLNHLHDCKIPMALATNSTEQAVRLHATIRPKLFGMFHHKVSVTDPEVDRGKPNPDIYLVAASRFREKPKPIQCLVFEDSAIGVEAAKEAGMQVVMIPDSRLGREQTRIATLVIRSLLDFKPELFGLPPFDNIPKRNSRI
ncbi:probable pseudouridine-5'-phosphatase, partial [Galleria mellonella]|uniref:Probable pseudouridine-5'-phosphatase n=1 Tax=Galleria mellonella TaxID=7137 RepID=A0ABM3MCK4_GALME